MAVPYVGKDVPSRSSEFAHPDVLIGLTVLAYRYEVKPYISRACIYQQSLYISRVIRVTSCRYQVKPASADLLGSLGAMRLFRVITIILVTSGLLGLSLIIQLKCN